MEGNLVSPTARPPLPRVPRPRRSTPASGATDNRLKRLDSLREPDVVGLEKSSGEAYPPAPETPERPRETAVEKKTRKAVDESNKAS